MQFVFLKVRVTFTHTVVGRFWCLDGTAGPRTAPGPTLPGPPDGGGGGPNSHVDGPRGDPRRAGQPPRVPWEARHAKQGSYLTVH